MRAAFLHEVSERVRPQEIPVRPQEILPVRVAPAQEKPLVQLQGQEVQVQEAPAPVVEAASAVVLEASAPTGAAAAAVPKAAGMLASRCERAEEALLGETHCGDAVKKRVERLEIELHGVAKPGGLQARLEAIESELGV
eukprot:2342122-Rhodomonas_salina.1